MTHVNLTAAVAEIRPTLMAGLEDRDLKAILAASVVRKFRAREVIIHQGTPAKYLYLLMSGRARYFFITRQGRKVLLRWLTPGDITGVAALLQGTGSHLLGTEMVRDRIS